ncbi:hypothetical protein AB0J38_25975 [Streptomyces sp. NPDC050095]|uniref:hypothetical protein n=1 Tax=unclassified Streptomyces TaxID=2593676 RepID=UPI003413EEE1
MKLIAKVCATGETCPAVLELDNGDYLVIGTQPTREQLDALPRHGAGVGPGELALVVPRAVMQDAAPHVTEGQR